MAANPGLSSIYTDYFKTSDWVCDLDIVKELGVNFAEDPEF